MIQTSNNSTKAYNSAAVSLYNDYKFSRLDIKKLDRVLLTKMANLINDWNNLLRVYNDV